jgi:outer membrane lipoprotein SlyB
MNSMSNIVLKILLIIGLELLFTSPVMSTELVIFPAQNQNNEQMEKDKYDCYQWAKQQSGFDPMAPPTTSSAPPVQGAQGGVVKGAARGALVGVTVGAITNNSKGRSAAAGAAAGGLVGGMRRQDQARQQNQAEQQWAQQETNTYAQQRNNYNRAYSACLEGKGYTVK